MTHPKTQQLLDDAAEEPVVLRASATSVVTALIAVLVAFGVPLSGDQQVAILGLVAVAGPLVSGWLTRSKVFAPATVSTLLAGRKPRD